MKKAYKARALFCALLFAASAGFGADAPAVTSACEVDYPPFCIVSESGEAGGFSVELMQAALKAMGREATFQTGTWDEVKQLLTDGNIEALPMVGRTPEREALFDFTVPYLTMHGAIVVREGETGIADLEDLRGKQVAVMKGDNAEEFLRREHRGIDIRTAPTFSDALRELSEGNHDAVVIQRLVALRLIRETGLKNLRIVEKPVSGFRQDFCFAVREGDRDTLALLNEGLALVVADGTYRHLHAKWFAALELPSRKAIIVGGDRNYPPFEYLDGNGQPAGYNVDISRAIALALGLDIEIRLGEWPDMVQALRDGDIDVLQGMFYSPARDLEFDFSPPHALNHCISVVRTGEGTPPDTIGKLLGKRIAVQQGDIMHGFALDNGLTNNLTAVGSQEEALQRVVSGETDCALVSRVTALYWMKLNGWTNLNLGQHPLISPEYCFAVPNGQRAMLASFGEGLRMIEDNGEYRRIQTKWFGVHETARRGWRDTLQHVAIIALPLLAVLFAVFLWSWSLHRQVTRRTADLQREVVERRLAEDKIRQLLQEETATRAALRGQTEFLNTLLDSIPLPVFYKDTRGRYLGFNRSFEQFFGKTHEELIGKSVFDVAPRELAEVYHQKDLELFGHPGYQIYETQMRDVRSRVHDVIYHKATFNDESGRLAGLIGAILDITDRKRFETELEELVNERTQAMKRMGAEQQTILDSIRASIVYKDANNNILRINRTGAGFLNRPPAEIEGRNLTEFFREEAPGLLQEDREIIRTGTSRLGVEEQMRFPSGDTRWMLTDKVPYRDEAGKIIGVIVMAVDITERKEAEDKLRQRSEDLRIMVNAMADREIRMTELKDEIMLLKERLAGRGDGEQDESEAEEEMR